MPGQAQRPGACFGRNALIVQEALYRVGVIAVQMQDDRAAGGGKPTQYCACQAWLEGLQELHGLQRGFSMRTQRAGLAGRSKQQLVFAQRLLDLTQPWPQCFAIDTQLAGGLAACVFKIMDAAVGDQASGFLRNQLPLAGIAWEGVR